MWIGRRLDGSIYGAWTTKQTQDADHPGIEEVEDAHPDLVAFRAPKPPIDFSDLNHIEKGIRALALCIADLHGLTPAQMRTLFKQKWGTLP